jgi:hypothetical protein
LDAETANYYQSLVGVLQWAVEIGRIDITTEVSMPAAKMAMPRKGHLFAVFRVFAYLKQKHIARMICDPTYPKIDYTTFRANEEWEKVYRNVKEAIPRNAPQPRVKPLVLSIFVDSDHAGDQFNQKVKDRIHSDGEHGDNCMAFPETRIYIRCNIW